MSLALVISSCGDDGPGRDDASTDAARDSDVFRCVAEGDLACEAETQLTCERSGEFLSTIRTNCPDMGMQCVEPLGCVVCRPEAIFCQDSETVVQCADDGSATVVIDTCDITEGFACRDGRCQNLCDIAIADKSYVGCEFFAADLDNAAIAIGRDASAQQFAVVVSNPGALPTEVVVEVNNAPYGSDADILEVENVLLLPGDLEVFQLDRREVDGSSSNVACRPDTRECPGSEVCLCSSGDTVAPCFCRVSAEASGLNDGTHTALTANAYRIRSQLPIIAYQFNPLDNVGVFSNDASMLSPTSAISTNYTVVGWPQTIADADCDPSDPACAQIDFNPAVDDEDLRAFLTIVGTADRTMVDLTMGPRVVRVLPFEDLIPIMGSGDTITLEVDAFDVINLETDGLNGDFTATRIEATQPVAVFVGSEASDAPRFENYTTRLCCADHLEEQLFGDETLGASFIIARMPRRSVALNDAFLDPTVDSVAEVNEPEYMRIVAVAPGTTEVVTTLPPPDDRITLDQYDAVIIPILQDFEMFTMGGKPLAVLQTLPSQEAVGIPSQYPGGDPAIVAIPPVEQYRRDYVFLTPDLYAFDFVTITAQRATRIELDGDLIYNGGDTEDPARCTVSAADGIARMPGDPPPDQVVIRCQLSFPDVVGIPNVMVLEGVQDDGVHTLVADQPVGVVVYGFDAFVSYAYAGGLNLKPIPR